MTSTEQGPLLDSTAGNTKVSVLSATGWDVWSPPPIDSLKGHFVPQALMKYRRRRRLTVEVHRVSVATGNTNEEGFYDECVVRILVPANEEERKASRKRGMDALKVKKIVRRQAAQMAGTSGRQSVSLVDHDGDSVVHGSVGEDLSRLGAELDEGESVVTEGGQNAWKPKYKLPVDSITIHKVIKSSCYLTTNYLGVRHARTIIFDSDDEAREFASLVEAQRGHEKARADQKLKAILGGVSVKGSEEVALLVEIVSAWGLPVADISSSDPYVVASLNGKEVHRTQYVPKTLDPIWTVKTGSLFLLKVTAKELFSSPDGMMLHVLDFDQFGANESLGAVYIPAKTLYENDGSRLELQLQKAPRQKQNYDYTESFLAVRCRHATEYDKRFMEQLTTGDKKPDHLDPKSVEAKASTVKGGKGGLQSMATRYRKRETSGPDAGLYKFRVRPGPDPHRVEETEWLSKKKIDEECLKESRHWLDLGSGLGGRLFVEILKCDRLPQLDTGIAGNKTDAFVSVIYEDGIMKTDIIDDCLSPRWLPWAKRAFIFHTMHSSSPLFLGIFDYDGGLGSFDDHDLIGKVTVDVSNLRPDTVYVMTFDIFDKASMTTRTPKGTITVRLRIEVDDERRLLLSNLEPPPQIFVNVSNRKDYRVAKQTVSGKYDENRFNQKVFDAYLEELYAYRYSTLYLQDALVALLLWRGHTTIKVFGNDISIPLHSINAFLLSIVLVERPELMPSFFFASIAWLMLAVMGFRLRSPNPWARCKSFGEMLQILLLGKSSVPPDSIEQFENEEEAREWLESMQQRVKRTEEQVAKAAEEAARLEEERQKELAEVGDVDTDLTSGAKGGFSLNPYAYILWPIQQYLAVAVRAIRLAKNIILWEECYFAFWITFGSLALAIVCFFCPFFFLLKWVSRCVAWSLFGPWMKLVDVFYYSKIQPLSEEEMEEQLSAERKRQREATAAEIKEVRVTKENTAKLKDIKKYMFGKFITKVPVLKQERYRCTPRPESFCKPYTPEPVGLADLAMKEAGYNRTRLPGQHLVGDMIPRVEAKSFTDAPVGHPTAHPSRLDKDSPGRTSGTDSTISAYSKIGVLVFAAGLITWFGVPKIASFMEKGIKM